MKSVPCGRSCREANIPAVSRLEELLVSGVDAAPKPWYSAAVAVVQRHGRIEQIATTGQTARFSDDRGTAAPPGLRGPVTESTVFDLASLTKLLVTTALLSLVEEGTLALDEPVATWLPSFAEGRRTEVTLRHLMTHTSGLPALLSLWTDWPDRPARVDALLHCPLRHRPGTTFDYSCVGYLVAGLLAEKVTGVGLADLVRTRVCEPLGLTDTGYLPPAERIARTAATEYQPAAGRGSGRGMVRGEVHDENSWSLGGTGGNAGIFGTARDLARFGEMLRGGGAVDGVRVLSAETVEQMTRDQLPASIDPGFRHGLGVRIGDPQFMGVLAAGGAFGHTGFTGTSLVVSGKDGLVVVLLTNRVHPSRDWSDITHLRRGVAELSLVPPK
jgi:CubicO group peptidase (beta-lactamase class C family)